MKLEVYKYHLQEFKKFLQSYGDEHQGFCNLIDGTLNKPPFRDINAQPPENFFTRLFK